MPVQDDQQAIDALTFPKVTVGHDKSGYLTPLSAKLLLIELERAGFKLIRNKVRAPDALDCYLCRS